MSVTMRLLPKNGLRRSWWMVVCALLFVVGCEPVMDVPVRKPGEGGLVFVTTFANPPYSYLDKETKEYAGIDVEIARAVAKKLDLPLKIVPMKFSYLLSSVKSGVADFAANAITITSARMRDVAFSRPYARDGSAFLYRVGSPVPTVPLARQLRVGCQNASTGHFYLSYHNIDPYCFDRYDDAVVEFAKGNLDVLFYDATLICETVRESNGVYAMTPLEMRENFGVAVRKDYPVLLEAINQVIAERSTK